MGAHFSFCEILVGDSYVIAVYGEYAGWAHTILFAADLVKFRDRRDEVSAVLTARPSYHASHVDVCPSVGGEYCCI